MEKKIRVFAPSTIANVSCGYDVLGFAIDNHGDYLTISLRNDALMVIHEIEGAEQISKNPDENVATVAIKAMLADLNAAVGFDLWMKKTIPAGSGLGSSASSSAAAVFGANHLLGSPFTKTQLVKYAMEGERAASGKPHADNVAPSLLGGFTVIRSYHPLDVFNIPYPDTLIAVVIYPDIEVKTSDAKKILKKQVTLHQAVTQWGNVAGLVSGLILKDFSLISRSMEDVIVEPVRSILIPMYQEIKAMSLESGALGFNISGSGPSMFALTTDVQIAATIEQKAKSAYAAMGIEVLTFHSKINPTGAKVFE